MYRQASVAFEGIDSDTPLNVKLSGKYVKSFAYYTLKSRIPVTLTKVINELTTNKADILRYREGGEEDLKSAIGKLSKLKNEIITNKCLIKLSSKGEDVKEWNDYLDSQTELLGEPPCWYHSPWLYVECYMYRRLWEVFENSETLQDYDPFQNQKINALKVSLPDIKILTKITLKALSEIEYSKKHVKDKFIEFMKVSLWSNKCDLSFSSGVLSYGEDFNLRSIIDLDFFLLCDDSEKVFDLLNNSQNRVIDFVTDNSSCELFSDFCFCDVLCTSSLSSKIIFHVKKIPWFVSDALIKDINWLLNKLDEEGFEMLSGRWRRYFQNGIWSVADERYWTLPFDFSDMEKRDPTLYWSLKSSDLVIFKGDLNYRKLLGDINWGHFENFEVAIRDFKPTNVLTLRTVKADLICGVNPEKYKRFDENDKMWMRTGDYGIIQLFCYKQSNY